MSDEVLQVRDLRVYYHTPSGPVKAVDGIDFSFVLVGPGAYRWPRARQFVAAHLRAPRQVAALRLGIQLLAGLG